MYVIIKNIIIFTIFFLFISLSYAQDNKWIDGYIVTSDNDTIKGKIFRKKDYYYNFHIKMLLPGGKKILYKHKKVSEIHIKKGASYFQNSIFNHGRNKYYKRIIKGHSSLYRLRNKYYIQKSNADLDRVLSISFKSTMRFYFSDYDSLIQQIEKKELTFKDIEKIITQYNTWKDDHPEKKSAFDTTYDYQKPIIYRLNFIALNACSEIKLSPSFTFKLGVGAHYGILFGGGRFLTMNTPYINGNVKYYYNISKIRKSNFRTFNYTSNYLSLFIQYTFKMNIYDLNNP